MKFETTRDGYPMKFTIELRGVYDEQSLPELNCWYPSPLRFPQYTILYELVMQTPWLVKNNGDGDAYLRKLAEQFLQSDEVKAMIQRVDDKYLTKSMAVVSLDHAWDEA